MARGIDAAAHEGSLASGTVAVLAGGIDDVYPPEHRPLYDRLAAQGCIVSENAVGRRAQARDFPRRNRLISGLSLGVVVVEAEMRSGSLITARLAGEQGREVFAVPGSPLDPRAKGTNDLIRQGAILCESAQDVIAGLRPPLIARETDRDPFRHGAMDEAALDKAIDELRGRIEALLSPTPIPRDELARLTGAPMAAVNGALVELALAAGPSCCPAAWRRRAANRPSPAPGRPRSAGRGCATPPASPPRWRRPGRSPPRRSQAWTVRPAWSLCRRRRPCSAPHLPLAPLPCQTRHASQRN